MTGGRTPRYFVFGAGAIGSVLGGFLQEIGCDVTYTGRGAHFKAMQDDGLKVTSMWGDRIITADRI